MSDLELIIEQAARLRETRVFGRSQVLVVLLDYLVQAARDGAKPKEVEIAMAVFGRDGSFDGARDATVRGAVHRLRKKLDGYYATLGRDEPVRLTIPPGEYRLFVATRTARIGPAPWMWMLVGALVALNLSTFALVWLARESGPRSLEPWASLERSDHPMIVVVGDYYIFEDSDPKTGVTRLVREYDVNSSSDLEQLQQTAPDRGMRFRDLDLRYLPVGAAPALARILPVLAKRGAPIRVILASDVTVDVIRDNDLVYVGYLSALGQLREPLFAASRFRFGETWDELIDGKTGLSYVSQEGPAADLLESRRDYGYLARYRGPKGTQILVIAGMRDVGLMEAAESAVDRATLAELARRTDAAPDFEALIEAEGLHRASFGGRLIVAGPLHQTPPWTKSSPYDFPVK